MCHHPFSFLYPDGLEKAMERNVFFVVSVVPRALTHVESPSKDLKTVPESPTAPARVALNTAASLRFRLVVAPDQLLPAFTVLRILPFAPTAKPVVAFRKKAPVKFWEVPLVCALQFVPPSVVVMMVPVSPTAQPTVVLKK